MRNLIWCALLTLSSTAVASPITFSHQGRLLDLTGMAVEGTIQMELRLFSQVSGGSPVWAEQHTVALADGYFSVAAGGGATLAPNAQLSSLDFANTSYWLEIHQVGGATLAPRSEIRAVPIALSVAGGYQPTSMTTAERDALSVGPGAIVFNTSTNELQTYSGSSWDSLRAGSSSGAYAWGDAQVGGLGTGDTVDRTYPSEIAIPGGTSFEVLAAGGYAHGGEPIGCAIDREQELYCWGRGNTVPNGHDADSFAPVNVSSGKLWRDVSLSFGLVGCGVTTANAAYCWGYQTYGGLGNGINTTAYLYTPQAVVGGIAWKVLRPGGKYNGSAHVAWLCGVSQTTGADNGYCWGVDTYSVLGNGAAGSNYTTPANGLLVGFEWDDIQTGSYHSCGVTVSSDGYCWGEGGSGRVGDGGTADNAAPELISGGHSWSHIGAGHAHSCGLDTDGAIWCWGDSSEYQLGHGITSDSNVPVAITDPSSDPVNNATVWTSLSVGYQHNCAIDSDEALWCWGHGGSGRQGDVELTDNKVPTRVQGELKVTVVAAGIEQTYTVGR
jgi:hypothetical protein